MCHRACTNFDSDFGWAIRMNFDTPVAFGLNVLLLYKQNCEWQGTTVTCSLSLLGVVWAPTVVACRCLPSSQLQWERAKMSPAAYSITAVCNLFVFKNVLKSEKSAQSVYVCYVPNVFLLRLIYGPVMLKNKSLPIVHAFMHPLHWHGWSTSTRGQHVPVPGKVTSYRCLKFCTKSHNLPSKRSAILKISLPFLAWIIDYTAPTITTGTVAFHPYL